MIPLLTTERDEFLSLSCMFCVFASNVFDCVFLVLFYAFASFPDIPAFLHNKVSVSFNPAFGSELCTLGESQVFMLETHV